MKMASAFIKYPIWMKYSEFNNSTEISKLQWYLYILKSGFYVSGKYLLPI